MNLLKKLHLKIKNDTKKSVIDYIQDYIKNNKIDIYKEKNLIIEYNIKKDSISKDIIETFKKYQKLYYEEYGKTVNFFIYENEKNISPQNTFDKLKNIINNTFYLYDISSKILLTNDNDYKVSRFYNKAKDDFSNFKNFYEEMKSLLNGFTPSSLLKINEKNDSKLIISIKNKNHPLNNNDLRNKLIEKLNKIKDNKGNNINNYMFCVEKISNSYTIKNFLSQFGKLMKNKFNAQLIFLIELDKKNFGMYVDDNLKKNISFTEIEKLYKKYMEQIFSSNNYNSLIEFLEKVLESLNIYYSS